MLTLVTVTQFLSGLTTLGVQICVLGSIGDAGIYSPRSYHFGVWRTIESVCSAVTANSAVRYEIRSSEKARGLDDCWF